MPGYPSSIRQRQPWPISPLDTNEEHRIQKKPPGMSSTLHESKISNAKWKWENLSSTNWFHFIYITSTSPSQSYSLRRAFPTSNKWCFWHQTRQKHETEKALSVASLWRWKRNYVPWWKWKWIFLSKDFQLDSVFHRHQSRLGKVARSLVRCQLTADKQTES